MLRSVISQLLRFYETLIVAECILSWFAGAGGIVTDIYEALYRVTEPFVGIFRRMLPGVGLGGVSVDFSPMVAIIALGIIERLMWLIV
jgi:uncharacterized protein YggT (Ycf19 family)